MEKDLSAMVRQLVPVFLRYGYEGATLSLISKATGLGRASLYHHFPGGKEKMAEAVLSYLVADFDATVLAPLRRGKEPVERLTAMSESLCQFYDNGRAGCILAVFSFGEGQTLFQAQVQLAMNTWLGLLAGALVEAGLDEQLARHRAEEAVVQIQGALVLTRILDSTEPFERVLRHLPAQLLSPSTY